MAKNIVLVIVTLMLIASLCLNAYLFIQLSIITSTSQYVSQMRAEASQITETYQTELPELNTEVASIS